MPYFRFRAAAIALAAVLIILLHVGPAMATPPDTAIDDGPAESSTTVQSDPAFQFSSDVSTATFECSIDSGSYSSCPSEYVVHLASGTHSVSVRAVDTTEGTDPTPAVRSFTLDYDARIRLDGDTLYYVEEDGNEMTQMDFTRDNDDLVIKELGGELELAAGPGCERFETFGWWGTLMAVKCPEDGIEFFDAEFGDGMDSLWGVPNGINSTLDGGAGSDGLQGGDGNDTVLGGPDDDGVYGGPGDDILDGGTGADYISDGDGNDLVDYSSRTNPVRVSLNGEGDDGEDGEEDWVMDIARVVGGSGDDEFVGNEYTNEFDGGDGDDIIDGRLGEDDIDGDDGDDAINSYDDSAEVPVCGDGDDTVSVDDGDDPGTDCETVSSGVDTWFSPDAPTWDLSVDYGADVEFTSFSTGGFECEIDSSGFDPCVSPLHVEEPVGNHQLKVRAKNFLGEADTTPATWSFRVVEPSVAEVVTDELRIDAPEGARNFLAIQYDNVEDEFRVMDENYYVRAEAGCNVMSQGVAFCPADGISSIRASVSDLDDSVSTGWSGLPVPTTIDLGEGDDTLFARTGGLTVIGGPGADSIEVGEGADDIDAGAGDDHVDVQDGDADVVDCGPGRDHAVFDEVDALENCDVVFVTVDAGELGVDAQSTLGADVDIEVSEEIVTIVDEDNVVHGSSPCTSVSESSVECPLEDIESADVKLSASGDVLRVALPEDTSTTIESFDGNDIVTGGAGDEYVASGGGDDVFRGGQGLDTYDSTTSGVDEPLSISLDNEANDGEPGVQDDIGSDVENVLGGAGDDEILGSESANLLDGGAGDNVLRGFEGDDAIAGGSGSDVIDGGLGADELSPGGSGTDTLDYLSRSESLEIHLDGSDFSGADGGEEGDDLSPGFERLLSGSGNDTIFGDSANETFVLGEGSDTLESGDGDDEVEARDGETDDVDCGVGDDSVEADPGDVVDGLTCESIAATYAVDITGGPAEGQHVSESAPTFTFDSTTPSVECKIDQGEWEACNSPFIPGDLEDGAHEFSVRPRNDTGSRVCPEFS